MGFFKKIFCNHYYLPVDKKFLDQFRDTSDCYSGELFNRYSVKEICQYCNKVKYRTEVKFAEYNGER